MERKLKIPASVLPRSRQGLVMWRELTADKFLAEFGLLTAALTDLAVKVKGSESDEILSDSLSQITNRKNDCWLSYCHLCSVANDASLTQAARHIEVAHQDLCDKIEDLEMHKQTNSSHVSSVSSGIDKNTSHSSVRSGEDCETNLSPAQLTEFKNLLQKIELSKITFYDNLSAARALANLELKQAWKQRLPEFFTDSLQKQSEIEGGSSAITLQDYSYLLQFCECAEIRSAVFTLQHNLACDGKTSNLPVIVEQLRLKQRLARLLGYPHYTDYKLSNNAIRNRAWLIKIGEAVRDKFLKLKESELNYLESVAQLLNGNSIHIEDSDIPFWKTKVDQSNHLSQRVFPLDATIELICQFVANSLGVSLQIQSETKSKWDDQIVLLEVTENHVRKGWIYLDLIARPNQKKQGEWVAYLGDRDAQGAHEELPIASVQCSYAVNKKSHATRLLLSFLDIKILFHEFGHALHHVLCKAEHPSASGFNTLKFDLVEVPSLLMEKLCYQSAFILPLLDIAKQSNNDIDIEILLQSLQRNRRSIFEDSILHLVAFSLIDLDLHSIEGEITPQTVTTICETHFKQCFPREHGKYKNLICQLAHVFAGPYSASYYSYLYAEIVSSAIFQRSDQQSDIFELNDKIFSAGSSQTLLGNILELIGEELPIEDMVNYYRCT